MCIRDSNYVGALNKCVKCGEAVPEWELYRILGLALNPEAWENREKDFKEFYDIAMMRAYDFDYDEVQELSLIHILSAPASCTPRAASPARSPSS